MKSVIIACIRLFISNKAFKAFTRLYYLALLPKFAQLGDRTIIEQPFYFGNPQFIKIGNNCIIGRNSDFGVIKSADKYGQISIGNNVSITSQCFIFSKDKITICDNVLIASNVFIVDCTHGYSKGNVPYILQPFEQVSEVIINQGCWIGQNVVITQGVTIGKQCIIGANSVVNSSIPDYCIAVGAPAKVIKRWNFTTNSWQKENR